MKTYFSDFDGASNTTSKLNQLENEKEPVVAFRACNIKDSGGSSQQSVGKHGEWNKIATWYIAEYLYHLFDFKLFGIVSNIILEVDMIQRMGSSQLLLMEFIFFIRKAELMEAAMHKY